MSDISNRLIDLLGGTTKVTGLLRAKLSTVQSWRRIGIAPHHANHIRLAVREADLSTAEVEALIAEFIGDDDVSPCVNVAGDIACGDAGSPDKAGAAIGVAA